MEAVRGHVDLSIAVHVCRIEWIRYHLMDLIAFQVLDDPIAATLQKMSYVFEKAVIWQSTR